jgi:hypothetical protein
MSRLLWGTVALLGVTVAVVLVPAAPGGPVPEQALAHIITPTGTPGPPMFHVEIDGDARNGNRPCDPVDVAAAVGGTHEVAVCMTNAPEPVLEFAFDVVYDDTLNQCVDEECGWPSHCLDDNPDANVGETLGSGLPTNPDLGSGSDCGGSGNDWHCAVAGVNLPICDNPYTTEADATLFCVGICGPYTSPVNADPWPLAVVTFDAASPGFDTLTLQDVAIWGESLNEIGSCNPVSEVEIPCFGATLDVQEWTPTPTATPTRGGAVGGVAEPPDIETAAAASGPGASVAGAAAAAMGAALLVAALGGGGWYARRRWRA